MVDLQLISPCPRLPAPSLTSISPTNGPITGGTTVTITGANFQTGAAVSLGGVPATNVTVLTATTITARTAAHTAKPVDIVVTNPDAQAASILNAFTYLGAVPAVTGLAPSSGPTTGGTVVTITGSNFSPSASVNCRLAE